MSGRGTIVYVHGAGDRGPQVDDHVARIERQLAAAGLGFDVVASRWGEAAGARLEGIDAALPPARGSTGSLEIAAASLADGPLMELAALSRLRVGAAGASAPVPDGESPELLLDICRWWVAAPEQTLPLADGGAIPMATACRSAAMEVADSPEYAAARSAAVPEQMLVAAVGRAVAATVAARTPAPADWLGEIQLRIAEAVLGLAIGTLLVGYAGIDVGPALKRWATDVIVPHRARIIREAGLGPADVVLYQRNREATQRFVAGSIADARSRSRPVVALGNSLGGVILVDVLSQPNVPRPDLLVTVGTQASLLARFGALHPLGQDAGMALFRPWINVYDRRDLLAFVASGVWPEEAGIEDREVDMGVGFPDAHGASYLGHPELYRIIGAHPAITEVPAPVPVPTNRRFTIRLGRRSRPVLRLFGVNDGNAYVDVDDDLDARFGFFRLRTPLANVDRWRIEGPWRWITAIGVRRSVRHGDVTFGGNHDDGVRLDFRQPVRWGPFRVPALYVTVADAEALTAALAARGIPGEDARRR